MSIFLGVELGQSQQSLLRERAIRATQSVTVVLAIEMTQLKR